MVELYVAECGLSWGMFPVYLKKKKMHSVVGGSVLQMSVMSDWLSVLNLLSPYIFSSTCPIKRHREECFSLYLYLRISLFFLLVLSIFPSYILKLFCCAYTHLRLLHLIGKWIPLFLCNSFMPLPQDIFLLPFLLLQWVPTVPWICCSAPIILRF